jgi:hypothetical protein
VSRWSRLPLAERDEAVERLGVGLDLEPDRAEHALLRVAAEHEVLPARERVARFEPCASRRRRRLWNEEHDGVCGVDLREVRQRPSSTGVAATTSGHVHVTSKSCSRREVIIHATRADSSAVAAAATYTRNITPPSFGEWTRCDALCTTRSALS